MRLADSFDQQLHKNLDLMLLLAKPDERPHLYPTKWTERKFYTNKESYTGYPYHKPISKILHGSK